MSKTKTKETALQWAVPKQLKIPGDPLNLRVDFHQQAVVVYTFEGETTTRRIVSAMDIVHALASEMTFSSGILPKNTLWWSNSAAGPVYAIYEEPRVRKLAIHFDVNNPPKRYTIPLPGTLFLCTPGRAPRVFAVKNRPYRLQDKLYHAPLLNMSRDGSSCAGSNPYPVEPEKIPESFWLSFFTAHGEIKGRSKKYPENIIRLWEALDGKKEYPLDDLVAAGTVGDLMKTKN
jgi:hypothetical protein